MRITGGEFKGLRFTPPAKNWPTRPTTDFAKEALHNILLNRIDYEDITFLDLFGGTGAHCYECISRGCLDATYVDKHRPAAEFVKGIAARLEIEDKLKILRMDVFSYIKSCKLQYDLIFAGPPYALNTIDKIPSLIFEANILKEGGTLIVEHNPNVKMDNIHGFYEQRNYGQTLFSFFKH